MYQVKVATHNTPQKEGKKYTRSRLVVQNHIALAMVTNGSVKPCRITLNKAARFFGVRIASL